MDPLSLLLVLGATTAVAAGAQEQLHATTRLHALQAHLGMASTGPTSDGIEQVSTEELPDELPADIPSSLWDIFDFPGKSISLQLTTLEWMGTKEDLDDTVWHSGYEPNILGYWQVNGESASREPRSLWDWMHRAWLGRTPTLRIDVNHGSDGVHAMGHSYIWVSYGEVKVDLQLVGESLEELGRDMAQDRLDEDDFELAGHVFTECFEARIYDQLEVHADHVDLGSIDESITEDSFQASMQVLMRLMSDLEEEARSRAGDAEQIVHQIASECTDQAVEAANEHRETYESYEDEDEDEDDEDDEDEEDEEDDDA